MSVLNVVGGLNTAVFVVAKFSTRLERAKTASKLVEGVTRIVLVGHEHSLLQYLYADSVVYCELTDALFRTYCG